MIRYRFETHHDGSLSLDNEIIENIKEKIVKLADCRESYLFSNQYCTFVKNIDLLLNDLNKLEKRIFEDEMKFFSILLSKLAYNHYKVFNLIQSLKRILKYCMDSHGMY